MLINDEIIIKFYYIFLLLTLILSFYIFVSVVIFKQNNLRPVYSSWHFPMLLALFFENI